MYYFIIQELFNNLLNISFVKVYRKLRTYYEYI